MKIERWLECGRCDGVGCWQCANKGVVESHAWRAAYDDHLADKADARRKGEDE